MPYALIPDGYTLKKVTEAQKKAVNDKRRHDDVLALLNNEATLQVVLGGIVAIVSGFLLDKFIEEIELPSIPLDTIEKAKKATLEATLLLNPITGPVVAGQKIGKGLKDLLESEDLYSKLGLK